MAAVAERRASAKLAATGREPEEWARATELARETRARIGAEVYERIVTVADQAAELIVAGDLMGSRDMVVARLQQVVVAERTQDAGGVRAAWMDVIVAAGACVAALDHKTPVVI